MEIDSTRLLMNYMWDIKEKKEINNIQVDVAVTYQDSGNLEEEQISGGSVKQESSFGLVKFQKFIKHPIRDIKQAAEYMNINYSKEIWVRDIYLGIYQLLWHYL